jgi:lipopolysaccharide biosynthesis glycosyltransferase
LFSRISYSSQNYSNQNEQKHIPVFLIADNNYAPFVATTMASILKNTKSFIEFYVINNGISEKNKQKIANEKKWFKNFSLNFVNIDNELLNKLNEKNAQKSIWPKIVYAKFFIPEFDVSKKIKKAIYLDCDIIVKKDIKSLYDIDLENYIIGAVTEDLIYNNKIYKLEHYNSYRKKEIENIKKITNNKQHIYFNSGVMLIDMEKWRKEKITEKAVKMASIIKNYFPDQTVLNAALSGKTKVLDSKYNEFTHKFELYGKHVDMDISKYIRENYPKAVIIHYAGKKPWNSMNVIKRDEFWKITKYTDFKTEFKYYSKYLEKNTNPDKTQDEMYKYTVKKKGGIINICISILVLSIITLILSCVILFKKKK